MRLSVVVLLCLAIAVVSSATTRPRPVITASRNTTKAPASKSAFDYLRTVRGKNSCAGGSCPFWERHGRSFAALRCYSRQYQECTCLHRMCFSSCMFTQADCNKEMVSCLQQICPRCMPSSASPMCAVYDSMAVRVAEALSVFACYPCCPILNGASTNTTSAASPTTTPAIGEGSTTVAFEVTDDIFGPSVTEYPEGGEYPSNNGNQPPTNTGPGTNQNGGSYPTNNVNSGASNGNTNSLPNTNGNGYPNTNTNGFVNNNGNGYPNTNTNNGFVNNNGNGYPNTNTNVFTNGNGNGFNNGYNNVNGQPNTNVNGQPGTNVNGQPNTNGNGLPNTNTNVNGQPGTNVNGQPSTNVNGQLNTNGNGLPNTNTNANSNPNSNGNTSGNTNSPATNNGAGNVNTAFNNGNGYSGNCNSANNYPGIVFPGSDAMFYNNNFPLRSQQAVKQRGRQTVRTTKRRRTTTRRTSTSTRRTASTNATVRPNSVKSGVRKPVQAAKKPQTNNRIKS